MTFVLFARHRYPQRLSCRALCSRSEGIQSLIHETNAQVFETGGKNNENVKVAGLSVSSGKLSRTHFFRVVRDEEVMTDRVKATSMRIHKDCVNEVTKDKVSAARCGCSRVYRRTTESTAATSAADETIQPLRGSVFIVSSVRYRNCYGTRRTMNFRIV